MFINFHASNQIYTNSFVDFEILFIYVLFYTHKKLKPRCPTYIYYFNYTINSTRINLI